MAAVTDTAHRDQVRRIVSWFEDRVEPRKATLPRGVVHQDLNDFNVLTTSATDGRRHISGVLDFGDALHTARVSELAVSVAYAMLRQADPLATAGDVVRGFNEVVALTDDELAVIYPMAAARLCVNAVTWESRNQDEPTEYGRRRMRHTWPTIARLVDLPPTFAEAALRIAAGRDGDQGAGDLIVEHLARRADSLAPAFRAPVNDVDLSVEGEDVPLPVRVPAGDASEASDRSGSAAIMAGRHLSSRRGHEQRRRTDAGEPATLQFGVDVYADGPTPVFLPLAGVVEGLADSPPGSTTVTLRHEAVEGLSFWSRWCFCGAYGPDVDIVPGQHLQTGARLGKTGPAARGDAVHRNHPDPGLQVALFVSRDVAESPPGRFVTAGLGAAWAAVSPDPSSFLGVARPAAADAGWDVEQVLRVRARHFARSQRNYYQHPMNLVRGEGVWLYDQEGRGYLDAINNVSHVGHANPAVRAAASRQLGRLNTNSRFVYEGIARYADRLAALLPDPLEVVFLVCTGSEANDLALRISRQVTGRQDVMVIDGAYHGNTSAVTGISPNRYKGPGGSGAPPTTHEVLQPNLYRGVYASEDSHAGARYAADVEATVRRLAARGTPPAAFIAESLMGTAGTVDLPQGYLASAFASVRSTGGFCISDEVQVGFGRLGESFWGFERHGVVPDIVTMGKPMGNGHPLAAVVTTREIAAAFDTGMKYFNTFGGNPVSCAVGMAVLDEIESKGLQARAGSTGQYFLDRLTTLADKHDLIGDVRGQGLYLGVELVRNRKTREPASVEAFYISERMKDEGVIVYPTGSLDNTLKIKPPMVFDCGHVDLFVSTLDEVLSRAW